MFLNTVKNRAYDSLCATVRKKNARKSFSLVKIIVRSVFCDSLDDFIVTISTKESNSKEQKSA